MKRFTVIFLFTLLVAISNANAVSGYLSDAVSKYPAIKGTKLNSCQLCHTTPPIRNPFGAAFAKANHDFAAIESQDSDGDGYTNLEEITAGTYPGNASDHPVAGEGEGETGTTDTTPASSGCFSTSSAKSASFNTQPLKDAVAQALDFLENLFNF